MATRQSVKGSITHPFWARACPIILALLVTTAAHADTQLTKHEQAQLHTGKAVAEVTLDTTGTGGNVRAAIDIPAAPSAVWSVMLDCQNASEFLDHLDACQVLKSSTTGRWDLRELRVRWRWFLPQTRSVVRSEYVTNRVIRFKGVGGDLRSLNGTWTFKPTEQGKSTRLFYEVHVDPGLYLPESWVRSLLRTDVISTMQALRRETIRRNPRHRL